MSSLKTKSFNEALGWIERYYFIITISILSLALINLLYNLGAVPFNSWDEARHGVNAYEMLKRNNYIVSTYAYQNDYWNLKPPVSYWAIISGYKLLGFNGLGLRISSAISAFITITLITYFAFIRYGRIASIVSCAVLVTSAQFILGHCARSGDADSIYVMFFTLSMVSLGLMEKSSNWFYVCGFAFAMAFLTKSWHAGNIVVIGVLYLFISKAIFQLNMKQILLFVLSCTLPILAWAFLRYLQDGLIFFKSMIGYDLLARTSSTLEGHVGDGLFYFRVINNWYFYWMLIFIFASVAAILTSRLRDLDRSGSRVLPLIVLWIMVPVILYSIAKTKIEWYIIPIYPALALVIGVSASYIFKGKNRKFILQLSLAIVLVLSFYKNEKLIFEQISKAGEDKSQTLLRGLGKLPQYRGKNIYIHHFEQSYWLCAEFYGDLVPLEGGVEGFLSDNTANSLLFITKDMEEMSEIKKYNLKVVAENGDAYIFTK